MTKELKAMNYRASLLALCMTVFSVMSPMAALAHGHEAASTPHANHAKAHYVANEGVVIRQGDLSIIFDPLPLSGFGVYPQPSAEQVAAMMAGEGAYAGLDVVFISHAHRDHFSAPAMLDLMSAQPDLHLVAPQQALEMMTGEPDWNAAMQARMTILTMSPGDAPRPINLPGLEATALRIPHAGWPAPARASVQNMVYRVTLNGGATIMHMGDADPRRSHFTPHSAHWNAVQTDTAFPPYWFLTSEEGRAILSDEMNAARSIGLHVPLEVPADLEASGQDYFSVPGETRDIERAEGGETP